MAPVEIRGVFQVARAFTFRLGGFVPQFEAGLSKPILVRTRDGYLFFCRPHTPDLYTVCCHELYELEKWFKPLVRGVFVDVGAYIGTYTVRACKNAEIVIAIEPLPHNFAVLKKNIELNQCSKKVVLVNKAVGSMRRVSYMELQKSMNYISYSTASLKHHRDEASKLIRIPVIEEPLDDILNSLGVDKINLMKIDIEGYATQALPGMVDSLSKTRYLIIEIFKEELGEVHRVLKRLGFRVVDVHGLNYLYLNESISL
ncbi:MAG: FkbM family methyltransferase [Candidatus Bathyarchaeia archaeon]